MGRKRCERSWNACALQAMYFNCLRTAQHKVMQVLAASRAQSPSQARTTNALQNPSAPHF